VAEQPLAQPAVPQLSALRLLTYNVWFADVAQEERMASIGRCISAHSPHVVCLQEVTPALERMLYASGSWSRDYAISPAPRDMAYYTLLAVRRPLAAGVVFRRTPFGGSRMARDVTSAVLSLNGGQFVVATSHLESFMSPAETGSRQRVAQLASALSELDRGAPPDALFAGDLNWDDREDGAMALPAGWADAWPKLRPRDLGFTYDSTANAMLLGGMRKRLDRVLFKGGRWQLAGIEMVGQEALPGVFYEKCTRGGGSKRLPVTNSDHFGLLCTCSFQS